MGRTAHFLSALAVAGAVLVAAGPAAAADPSAEVSPGSVAPGGTVTVSVSCGALGVAAPETLEAASQAFADGAVKLTKVPGGDAQADAAYQGTAAVAPAAELEVSPDAVGPDAAWTVDGACPAAPGGPGKPWSATLDVARTPAPPCGAAAGESCSTAKPCPQPLTAAQPHPAGCRTAPPCGRPEAQPRGAASPTDCPPASVDHGVRAGAGGAFTDSVPALAAGGLLIAGALGAAVHRLRRRGPSVDA
ncbi:hypothetical protein ABT300_16445 [Streptomyces sp. NPDC001027]|uniref:hypothetical protein n=1 Tax=Streptomyces sp. NPDC001027 TaxID=3154771 RepID=UPI00332B45DD